MIQYAGAVTTGALERKAVRLAMTGITNTYVIHAVKRQRRFSMGSSKNVDASKPHPQAASNGPGGQPVVFPCGQRETITQPTLHSLAATQWGKNDQSGFDWPHVAGHHSA